MKTHSIARDAQIVMTFFLLVTIATSSVVWVSLAPRPSEPFFALFTLGAGGGVGSYYPTNSSDIYPGDELQWYVGVYNRMNSIQYVAIRFKLLNQTMSAPDSQRQVPSAANAFMQIKHVLLKNETWIAPIRWSVTNATEARSIVTIFAIVFNSTVVTENLSVAAKNGYNFRMVIELWVYTPETQEFEFAWMSAGQLRSSWNQIWFNMTQT